MDENNKFDVVGTNIAEKATMIWNVADMLRGPFKPHEYGLVILPMTVVKRFCSKDKPVHRAGKVQLIDASHCFEARRKSIGTKRNDITDKCRDLIVKAYGAFENGTIYGEKDGIYCQSKIFDTEEFGYQKIVVEQPQKDENGEIVLKKGKPVADVSLRDTENVPLTEDIEEYFKREVLPYAPEAWIDEKKTKKGYEIPMTRYFYEYQAPEPVEEIAVRLHELELDIQSSLDALFGEK